MKKLVTIFAAGLITCSLNAGERVELSKIDHFCPKGRVQDRESNPRLPVIETLIGKGTNCIPMLIELLSDDTRIDHQIIDYWPSHTVGDIALVILTDLTTDSSWTNSTIPGASWDEVLGKPTTNYGVIPPYYQLQDFKQKHGSREIRKRWEKIWQDHQGQVYWDSKERCFKLHSNQKASNQGAPANRRPAGQADGSGNLFATVAADRAFPAAVAELGSLAREIR